MNAQTTIYAINDEIHATENEKRDCVRDGDTRAIRFYDNRLKELFELREMCREGERLTRHYQALLADVIERHS